MTTVSIIVPAYNEGRELAANLVRLADYLSPYSSAYAFEFIVVDDGSTDETPEVCEQFARFRRNVHVVHHEGNRGLGEALRTGFARATGEYTVVVDADLSYDPSIAMQLLEAIESRHADIALASAYVRGGCVANVPPVRRLLSREANRLLSLAANGKHATFTCMVRAYRTSLLRQIVFHADGMENSAEILLAAIRLRASIVEIPAELRWSEGRRAARGRFRAMSTLRHIFATTRLAFAFRPALWLAVPGLFPGLLPLVVVILLLLHVRPTTLALATAVTVGVQYTSLAVFAGQLGSFFTRAFLRERKHAAAQRGVHL